MLGTVIACLLVVLVCASALAAWAWKLRRWSVELSTLKTLLERQAFDQRRDAAYQERGYVAMRSLAEMEKSLSRIEEKLGHVLSGRGN